MLGILCGMAFDLQDYIFGATFENREENEDFATYVNGFYPSLNFTCFRFRCAAAFPEVLLFHKFAASY